MSNQPKNMVLSTNEQITLVVNIDFDEILEKPKSKHQLFIEGKIPASSSHLISESNSIPETVEETANATLNIITKRYAMFRRTLSHDKKTKLDREFIDHILEELHGKPGTRSGEKQTLKKEKSAAFQHIKNSITGLVLTLNQYEHLSKITDHETVLSLVARLFQATLNELYTGDQRFYKDEIKTRSEVAKEGGLARKEHYISTKQEAYKLLTILAPPQGWRSELDAFTAILPKTKSYLKDNDIRRPALSSIERTLRRWIKNDPLVSSAVKININPSSTKAPI